MDTRPNRTILLTAFLSSISTALMLSGGAAFLVFNNPELINQRATPWVSEAGKRGPELYPQEALVIGAVERASRAVVDISVSKNLPRITRYYEELPIGPFSIPVPRYRSEGNEEREVGGGSGFLVSSDGYIVTNRHVVDDRDAEYTVFLNDGSEHQAAIIARDTAYDIAVIKIEGSNFPYLSFANSDSVLVGQTAIAIGNALAEFQNTVSLGIISGLGRTVLASDLAGNAKLLDEVIQTDAAINLGNSGGPLLNLSGNVIGMNVAVAGGAENIGFAIPANVVAEVVESVRATGAISRAYLGVHYLPITEEVAAERSLSVGYGALLEQGSDTEPAIVPSSPAAKANLREGDIVLSIDGESIDARRTLAQIMRTKRVGESITLTILRDREEQQVTVILESYPNEE